MPIFLLLSKYQTPENACSGAPAVEIMGKPDSANYPNVLNAFEFVAMSRVPIKSAYAHYCSPIGLMSAVG